MIAPQYGDNFQGKCGARGTYASAFTTISLPERVVYVPQLGQTVWPGVLLPQFWHLRSFGARHAGAARRVRCFILDVLRLGAAIILVGKKVINDDLPVH